MTMYSLIKISGYIKNTKRSDLQSDTDVITAIISDADNYCTVELGLYKSANEAIKKMQTFSPVTIEITPDSFLVLGYFVQENEYNYSEENYILQYYGDIHSFNVSAVQ